MLYLLFIGVCACLIYLFHKDSLIVAITAGCLAVCMIVGSVITCNSDFLSCKTEESHNTYQLTEFKAEKKQYNKFKYETKYNFVINENYSETISSLDDDLDIICKTYKPTKVTIETEKWFKWWFLAYYEPTTYAFS